MKSIRRMIIAGGTGFLGTSLANSFQESDYEVVILSRENRPNSGNIRYVKWDGKSLDYWIHELEGAEVLINLTGKSVDCRYHNANKQEIYNSRIDATYVLGQAIQMAKNPPSVWINASSATIYRYSEDREMDEETGEIGSGFSVDVCQKWERMFYSMDLPRTRRVALRIGIVLGKNGGALLPLKRLAQIGFGGRHGSGRQFFSWIHIDDFIRTVDFVISNSELSGNLNVTAPEPLPNLELMRVMRKKLRIPFGITIPIPFLKFGSWLIQTESELLLKSRRVIPKKLEQFGFEFKHKSLSSALDSLLFF